MREVDFYSHFMFASGLAIVLVGGMVAGMGIFFVLALFGLIAWASSTGLSFGLVMGTIGCAATSTIPGLLVGSPGLLLTGAILWGRLRSRWSHIKWQEWREEDVEEERRRLEEIDARRTVDVTEVEARRRESLAAVARPERGT